MEEKRTIQHENEPVDGKRDVLKNSRDYIEAARPEYIIKECPKCGGRIGVFGLGPGGKTDYSLLRVICWECGKRLLYKEDKENKCYVETEEQK